ncbi:uncharacterized protein involved in exopolysaccharide biosynthesis [Roseibium marinum]|uniref:Uncharacterized protein involved in exopolysaccharide biosynthesis n=1 Tax=Roseibium marinum TaxID=281252 RepID=A0A2S3V2V7_9HYPH|nr:uncharacterized protein involved in exopolysaccharide biosynthesis [Roseibium marinum]
MLLCAIAGAVAAAAISISLKPIYRATTQVLIDPSVRQPFEDRSAPTRYLEDTFVVDSQVTVLQSSSVLRNVVTHLNLTEDPEFGDQPASQGILTSLFGGSGKGSPETQEASANSSVEALRDAMSVDREGLTFVINVSVDAGSPIQAAILSNAIVETYITDQAGQVSNVGRTVEEKVGDRLKILRGQLREAEARVEAFKAKNNLQSTDQNGLLTDQELAELNTQLTEQKAALAAAEAKASEIRRMIDSGADLDALTDVTASTTIANLRQQYATVARAEANLSAELLPSHPDLIRARAQTREIRGQIESEIRRIASTAQLEADVLRDRVAKLEIQLDTVRSRSNLDQQSRIELQELQIDADTNKTLYENLLSRTKEITEIDQISIPNARIISPAIPPSSPVWPKKKLLVLLGLFLGGMIGTLLAIGRSAFSLCMRYLLYPRSDVAYASAGDLATPAVPEIPAPRSPQLAPQAPPAALAVSYLPRPPSQGRLEDMDTEDLLTSLWDFKSGATDREMRPYWKSVFTILKKLQSDRVDGFASTVIVTSTDGGHSMAALSVVFAAASLKNFRVLLVDNNAAAERLSPKMLDRPHPATDLNDAVKLANLDIDFLSLTHGRRKYQQDTKDSYQVLNGSGLDPEFDLIVISESPMASPQVEAVLRDAADHVIVSVERSAALSA